VTVIDSYRFLYVNRLGEPVCTHELSFVNAERQASKENGRYTDFKRQSYTPEDIERIDAVYAAEEVRGAETRWWEDVNVGDTLAPVVKGPLRICDIVGFHIGWGMGQTYGQDPCAYGWEAPSPHARFLTLAMSTGFPTIVQRLHWDEKRAADLGLPAPYDYGTMRTNWLGHLITNWMGDEGWLMRLKTEMRVFNFSRRYHDLLGRSRGQARGRHSQGG